MQCRLQRNALHVLAPPDAKKAAEFAASAADGDLDARPRQRQRTHKRKPAAPRADKKLPVVKRPPAGAAGAGSSATATALDFTQLRPEALRRYRRQYRVANVAPGASRDQLVAAVKRHFVTSQTVPDDETKLIHSIIAVAHRQLLESL